MARTAFNQEAQYDLREPTIIDFKCGKIKMLGFSNSNIRYKIISNC